MPKITVRVLKTVKFFTHEEVEAGNDLDAMRSALLKIKKNEREGEKVYWDCDKPIYSAEVVK